jgi:Flp pilus assembly protein TadD
MKRHMLLWSVVAAFVVVAAGSVWLRGAFQSLPWAGPSLETRVAETIILLEEDPGAGAPATQRAVRALSGPLEDHRPRTAEMCYILAIQYQRESNWVSAEAMFRRAIVGKAKWAAPHAGLGSLLGRHTAGRFDEAKEALEQAMALRPEWSRPHNVLAIAWRLQDNYEEAEKEALLALKLDPGDIAVHNNYANLLVELRRFEEAEKHYLIAIETNPEHPKPYYNLACLYSHQGDRERALENLQSALKRAPNLRNHASRDPDFDPLRDNPDFQALVYGKRTESKENTP